MYEQRKQSTKQWEPIGKDAMLELFKQNGYSENSTNKAVDKMGLGETYYLNDIAVRAQRKETMKLFE